MITRFNKVFLSIILPILSLSLANFTHAQSWTQLSPTGSVPETREGHTAIYDAVNNRMTTFGGASGTNDFNDAWVLSNANGLGGTPLWTPLFSTGNTPTAREYFSAVYDNADNLMTIFGGFSISTYLNDVWVLSTANGLGSTPAWTQLSPTGSAPTTRSGMSAVYDTTNNIMTIFGGQAPFGNLNDVWVLSNANGLGGTPAWNQLAPAGSIPTTRRDATAVYDNTNNRMTIFGGDYRDSTSSRVYLNDVWVLSNANGLEGTPTWAQLSPTGSAPTTRTSATALYDPTNNKMIMFGGYSGATYLNDVWVLSNANGLGETPAWAQLAPTGNLPPIRESHTAIYDTTNNIMTIFGGYNGTTYNDVWVLSNANGLGGTPSWTQLFPTASVPETREAHSAIYDAVNNRMTAFGGVSGSNYLNDIWVLSSANGMGGTSTWTPLFSSGSTPTAREFFSAVYDNSSNLMTIFGGFDNSGLLNDVWVLSNANGLGGISAWTQLTPTGSAPTTRSGMTAVYDTTNNIMTIFGGFSSNTAGAVYLNDLWVLSNANGLGGTPAWTQLTPTGSPPTTRRDPTAVYDNTNNRMILFGGDFKDSTSSRVYLNDVWVLSNANGIGGTPTWTQLSTTGSIPTTRTSATAVYDPTNNRMIIFGGYSGATYLNDVWVLSNANGLGGTPAWTQLVPSSSLPMIRDAHTAVYDATNNLMTIFGGYSGSTYLNDVWVLSMANGLPVELSSFETNKEEDVNALENRRK